MAVAVHERVAIGNCLENRADGPRLRLRTERRVKLVAQRKGILLVIGQAPICHVNAMHILHGGSEAADKLPANVRTRLRGKQRLQPIPAHLVEDDPVARLAAHDLVRPRAGDSGVAGSLRQLQLGSDQTMRDRRLEQLEGLRPHIEHLGGSAFPNPRQIGAFELKELVPRPLRRQQAQLVELARTEQRERI